jgi:hypothetical protein
MSVKVWTKEEDIKLIQNVKKNMSLSELADYHRRTKKAITYRLYNIAYRMIHKGGDIYTICEKLKINYDSFNQVLDNMQLYNSIDRIKTPLLSKNFNYSTFEDQFIDDNNEKNYDKNVNNCITELETSESSDSYKSCETKYICKKCLKYESMINKFISDYESLKKEGNKSNKKLILFDIYSDDDDIC